MLLYFVIILFFIIIAEIIEEFDTVIVKPMEDRQNTEKCVNEQILAQDNNSEGQAAVSKTEKSKSDEAGFEVLERKEKATDEDEVTEEKQQTEAGVKVELCKSVPNMEKNLISDTDLFGYVGIEAVLDQIKNKTVKTGFEFNLMVVGKFSQLLLYLHVQTLSNVEKCMHAHTHTHTPHTQIQHTLEF